MYIIILKIHNDKKNVIGVVNIRDIQELAKTFKEAQEVEQ